MIAIQGPKVIERLAGVLPVDVKGMKRYHFESGSYMGLLKFTVFRSGYTGEDGVEIVIPAKVAGMAMKMLAGKMDKETATIKPAGLGARDTLRLEAGMPLYGHELTESIDPISAGLGWAADLSKEFIVEDPTEHKLLSREGACLHYSPSEQIMLDYLEHLFNREVFNRLQLSVLSAPRQRRTIFAVGLELK